MGSSSPSQKATDSVANVMGTFIRTGRQDSWKKNGYFAGSGKRTYFLCAHCHDPHDPKFKPLKPEPPPFNHELAKLPHTGRGPLQHFANEKQKYTRRQFIRNFSLTALGGMALPLLSSCTKQEAEDFLQKRFVEMTSDEKKQVIAKLEQRYLQQYGKKFQISTQEALPDTLWGYGLELSRCIGCRRCVYACVKENNQSRYKPQLQWIRVLRLKKGSLINLEKLRALL